MAYGDAEVAGWRSNAGGGFPAAPLILAGVVFLACLFGIFTRPVGSLATVWPANAIMLGLLIRMPGAATIAGWSCAAAAFMAADLLTGSPIFRAALLNGANMAGIGVAFAIYSRLPVTMARLGQPASMLWLLFASAMAGAAAGIVGAIADPVLFGGSAMEGWAFWFATELVNYITILPVLLSARPFKLADGSEGIFSRYREASSVYPVIALVLSCVVAMTVGGPGAIAFPVPALLWCGLVFPVFGTALLSLAYGCWALAVIATALLATSGLYHDGDMISLRLGISLVALAPVMLSIVMDGRKDLLERLHRMATHDQLTDLLNRAAFRERIESAVSEGHTRFALMMIDLDYFKAVNDTYGHGGGDEVLVAFAKRVGSCLRAQDALGRLGGEEFVGLITDCSEAEANDIAERVRLVASTTPIALRNGRRVSITASIGLVVVDRANGVCIDGLFAAVDELLYEAKDNGRNRVERAVFDSGEGL